MYFVANRRWPAKSHRKGVPTFEAPLGSLARIFTAENAESAEIEFR